MNLQPNIERRVGMFVFLGILVACGLIIHFGKVGDRFRGGFPITIEFNNAGGLVRGAQVLYGGVHVGKVNSVKLNANGTLTLVEVDLFEGEGHKIRSDVKFMIKTSGLLGDQHIRVVPVSSTAPPIKPHQSYRGVDPFDFSDAAGQAGDAIRKLSSAIGKLNAVIEEPDTLDNLKKAFRNFAELGRKLEKNSDQMDVILNRIQKGQGTLGKLVTDDSLFEELKLLIHNWRVYGILHQEKSEQRYPSPRTTQK